MIKEAKELLQSFVGVVTGLTESQYNALNKLQREIDRLESPNDFKKSQINTAKQLRNEGLSIRGIMYSMGYKHPGSISHLLNSKS